MKKNRILITLFTICLLNVQLSIGQNVEPIQISSDSMRPQLLDETCNVMTTNAGINSYVFTVMPLDQTLDCTHFFLYFAYNPKTAAWYPYVTDSISAPPYTVQVGFSKNVTYRVQHYIVSKDNNHVSNIFEADFVLKKNLVAITGEDNKLDMLSQRNLEAISNTDLNIPVYFTCNTTIQTHQN